MYVLVKQSYSQTLYNGIGAGISYGRQDETFDQFYQLLVTSINSGDYLLIAGLSLLSAMVSLSERIYIQFNLNELHNSS